MACGCAYLPNRLQGNHDESAQKNQEEQLSITAFPSNPINIGLQEFSLPGFEFLVSLQTEFVRKDSNDCRQKVSEVSQKIVHKRTKQIPNCYVCSLGVLLKITTTHRMIFSVIYPRLWSSPLGHNELEFDE